MEGRLTNEKIFHPANRWFIKTKCTDVSDAVSSLIREAPQELTGECTVWKNYVDFPVGKM